MYFLNKQLNVKSHDNIALNILGEMKAMAYEFAARGASVALGLKSHKGQRLI